MAVTKQFLALSVIILLVTISGCKIKYPQKIIVTLKSEAKQVSKQLEVYYDVEYFSNGKKYLNQMVISYWTPWQRVVHDGNVYLMKCDSIHPLRFDSFLGEPIFLSSSKTEKTIATITKRYWVSGLYSYPVVFTFEYTVNGEKYLNRQLVGKQRVRQDSIKIGAQIPIEYQVENPKNSILLLDSLTTETINGICFRYLKFK